MTATAVPDDRVRLKQELGGWLRRGGDLLQLNEVATSHDALFDSDETAILRSALKQIEGALQAIKSGASPTWELVRLASDAAYVIGGITYLSQSNVNAMRARKEPLNQKQAKEHSRRMAVLSHLLTQRGLARATQISPAQKRALLRDLNSETQDVVRRGRPGALKLNGLQDITSRTLTDDLADCGLASSQPQRPRTRAGTSKTNRSSKQ